MSGRDPLEARLRVLRSAAPSSGLRANVLAAASEGLRPRVRWTDRIYASRALRIAWAVAIVLMVGAEALHVRSMQRDGLSISTAEEAARMADDLELDGNTERWIEHRLSLEEPEALDPGAIPLD